jgi:hypothetical protein
VENGSVVEFYVPIDNGLSVVLNIDTYGPFDDNGTFSAYASGATINDFNSLLMLYCMHDILFLISL